MVVSLLLMVPNAQLARNRARLNLVLMRAIVITHVSSFRPVGVLIFVVVVGAGTVFLGGCSPFLLK